MTMHVDGQGHYIECSWLTAMAWPFSCLYHSLGLKNIVVSGPETWTKNRVGWSGLFFTMVLIKYTKLIIAHVFVFVVF